jgi:hypothetical protein
MQIMYGVEHFTEGTALGAQFILTKHPL